MVVVVAPSRCRRCLGRVRIVALLHHHHRPQCCCCCYVVAIVVAAVVTVVVAAALLRRTAVSMASIHSRFSFHGSFARRCNKLNK